MPSRSSRKTIARSKTCSRSSKRRRATAESKSSLWRSARSLTVHATIEEEVFYPALEGKVDEDLLKESFVEHDAAKVMIAEIEAGAPSDEFYDAKVKVLSEEIEHHVEEEEKRVEGLFAQARKADVDLDELGARMAMHKERLQAEIAAGGLPAPETTTLDEVQV